MILVTSNILPKVLNENIVDNRLDIINNYKGEIKKNYIKKLEFGLFSNAYFFLIEQIII
jgi:hypothetical protein